MRRSIESLSAVSTTQRAVMGRQLLLSGQIGPLLACVIAGIALGVACVAINPLYLFAVVGAAPLAWWCASSVRRALMTLLVVIAILPRFTLPIKIGVTPTFLDLALAGLLIAWLRERRLRLPLPATGQANREPDRPIAITAPLVCLIAVTLVAFIAGLPNGALTPLVLRRFVELELSLACIWLFAALLQRRHEQERLIRWVLIAGGLAAALGIVLYAAPAAPATSLLSALRPFGYPAGPGVLRYVLDDPSELKRATGLWIDPNAYGGFLLVVGALGLPQVFAKRPVLARPAALLCMGLIAAALLLSVSRGAMLGFVLVALVMGTLRYRQIWLWCALGLVLALALPQTRELINHFVDGFQGRDLATQMRYGEYKDAFRLIARYPLAGVGFIDTPDVDLYIGVSSMYLLIMQQMGILGISAFAAVILALFGSAAYAWRAVRTDDD